MKFFVKEVLKELENNEVTVVAATKYFNSEEMRELFSEGITHFGENRVELLLEKSSNLEDLDINDLITKEKQQKIKDAVAIHGALSHKTLIDNLPKSISYGEIKMVLAAEKT